MTYGKPPIIFSVPIKQERRALQGETESLLSQVPGKLWGKSSKDSVNNTSNPIEITINKTDKSQIPNNLPWDKISWGINLTVHECLEGVYNLLKLPLVHCSMGEAKWKKMEICANFQCCPILCKAI